MCTASIRISHTILGNLPTDSCPAQNFLLRQTSSLCEIPSEKIIPGKNTSKKTPHEKYPRDIHNGGKYKQIKNYLDKIGKKHKLIISRNKTSLFCSFLALFVSRSC